jgi:hypothetical protein
MCKDENFKLGEVFCKLVGGAIECGEMASTAGGTKAV